MKIENVIATADLKQPVDATKFINYRWGTYDSEYYGGRCGYIKDSQMRGRVTVFLTGKLISTGCKSIREAVAQLEYVAELLAVEGFVRRTKINPLIRNIVATDSVNSMLDLSKMATELKDLIYEPEQFPGIISRVNDGPTCLIFSTGRMVLVGAKSLKELKERDKEIRKKMANYMVTMI